MLKSLYGSFVVAALILSSCAQKKVEEAATEKKAHDPSQVVFTPQQYKTAGIQIGSVVNTNLSSYIKASGSIDVPPQQMMSVTSPYGGTIKSTNVLEGRYIAKGKVVASIENPEFLQIQQDYLESSSQLDFLKQDLARQEELVKENIAARKSLQRASSEYNSAFARVEGLKAKLRMINIDPERVQAGNFSSTSNIYAPQGGYVTKVYSNIGKYIGPNEMIATMANTKSIMVRVRVFEKDLPHIHLGQKIRFRATGDSIERIANIFLIGKDIDVDRTVEVFGKIVAPGESLLPGMFINAIVELGAADLPALPQEAIVQAAGNNYIFVQQPSEKGGEENATAKTDSATNEIVFKRVQVNTGVTENGYTAVNLPDNVNKESPIVIKGTYDLLSKMNNSEEE